MFSAAHQRVRARRGGRRENGFTLVELLVVIGIIAVLMSILVPTLIRAQVSSRKTVCLSNLRQLGLGMGMYLVQYKGVFPGHKESVANLDKFWGDAIMPNLKTTQIFRCPDMDNDPRVDNGYLWKFNFDAQSISYGYNAYFLGHAAYSDKNPEYGYKPIIPPQNWMKVTQVKQSYNCLMFADSSPPYVFSLWWPYAASTKTFTGPGNEGVTTRRHKGVGCIVFVDGHCETKVDKEINPRFNYPISDKTNLKYWDPKQRL